MKDPPFFKATQNKYVIFFLWEMFFPFLLDKFLFKNTGTQMHTHTNWCIEHTNFLLFYHNKEILRDFPKKEKKILIKELLT
jgi:hypothetical protein